MYNPQPTTTISFIQQPPISNPTYLGHHGYYHEPIHHPEFLPLTNDSVSLLSPPTLMVEEDTLKSHECYVDPVFALVAEQKVAITEVKGEAEEVNSQEIITKNNFATIANEENLTIGERSQELIVTAEKDPPSFTQLIPQSILPSGDSDPIASSAIFVCDSDLWLSGSKPCFDFIFLPSDPIGSSCFKLEKVAWETTVPSPAKTKGNTIFVFDPDGISPCYEFSSATTPPPPRSTFVFDPGGDRDFQSFVFCLDLLHFAQSCHHSSLEWETMHPHSRGSVSGDDW